MMNRDDLVAEYDKISNEINVLSKRKLAVKDELLKLSEEEYDSVCAKWQQFVGKCFKKECAAYPKYSQYFIIIDVPKIENNSTYGKVYNKYKVKAFMFQPIDSITEVKTITSNCGRTVDYCELLFSSTTKAQFAPSEDKTTMTFAVSDNNLSLPQLQCNINKEVLRDLIINLKSL